MTYTSAPFTAPTGDQGIDWATVIVSLVVGVLGGVVSALITTAAQRGLARSTARAAASSALWTFQRTLHDFGVEGESHFVDTGSVTLTTTTSEDIARARAVAYPYRDYLKDKASLVERLWRPEGWEGEDPTVPYNDVYKWSQDLADAIKAVFGKDRR